MQKFNDKNSNWKMGKKAQIHSRQKQFHRIPDEHFKKKNASTLFVINRNRSTDRLKEKNKLILTDALKYLIVQKPFLMKQRNKPWQMRN